MKIMLDNSENQILEKERKFNHEFWQLQTPLSRRKLSARKYGLDNGCFARFEEKTWSRMLTDALVNEPVFVCLPDVVGSARRTLELFSQFERKTIGLPRALVLQDGIGDFDIPWDSLSAVFVGGTNQFKLSEECFHACRAAKILGKWVHVGRINTVSRLENWIGLGDSLDGSGISKYDHMLEDLVNGLKNENPQVELI